MKGGGWRFFGQHNTSQGSISDAPQHRVDRLLPRTASLRSEVSDMPIYDEYRIVINKLSAELAKPSLEQRRCA
jgi:hypothetical protein